MDSWTIGSTESDRVLNNLLAKAAEDDNVCIGFDYFDTLVTRTVYPEYTKQMASELLSLACGTIVGAS